MDPVDQHLGGTAIRSTGAGGDGVIEDEEEGLIERPISVDVDHLFGSAINRLVDVPIAVTVFDEGDPVEGEANGVWLPQHSIGMEICSEISDGCGRSEPSTTEPVAVGADIVGVKCGLCNLIILKCFSDINLTAIWPRDRACPVIWEEVIASEHPERRPVEASYWHFYTRFNFSVLEREFALGPDSSARPNPVLLLSCDDEIAFAIGCGGIN